MSKNHYKPDAASGWKTSSTEFGVLCTCGGYHVRATCPSSMPTATYGSSGIGAARQMRSLTVMALIRHQTMRYALRTLRRTLWRAKWPPAGMESRDSAGQRRLQLHCCDCLSTCTGQPRPAAIVEASPASSTMISKGSRLSCSHQLPMLHSYLQLHVADSGNPRSEEPSTSGNVTRDDQGSSLIERVLWTFHSRLFHLQKISIS